jgi:outer membrane protein assembly factor BamB
MTEINWGKVSVLAAFFISFIVIFGIFYDSEPDVTVYRVPGGLEGVNWYTYRVDVTHQGIAPPDCVVDEGLIPEWVTGRLNKGEYSASKSSPAVDEKRIYIGLDTRALVAIDRETGRIVWRFYTRLSRNGIHGSPTVDPDRNLVYIGAYDGWIYALNRDTGKLVWNTKLGDFIGSSPTLYDDIVYIGVEMRGPDGYIVGVDANTGEEVFRSSKLGNHPHSTPTIDPDSGCVFIGANNGFFYCYWINNQTERWSFKTGKDIKSTASVNGGVVYITSWDGSIYAIDILTGKSLWSYSTQRSSMSSPTIDGDRKVVYFGNHGGSFYAVNASTGKRLWVFETDDRILSSPTLVRETRTVIIGSGDGNVYLLDSDSGKLKQKIALNSGLTGVPVAVGSRLYVFDHLGYLYSFVKG